MHQLPFEVEPVPQQRGYRVGQPQLAVDEQDAAGDGADVDSDAETKGRESPAVERAFQGSLGESKRILDSASESFPRTNESVAELRAAGLAP